MMETGFSSPRKDAFPAGLRVLVVDDDPTWLNILEKMLKKCSYKVTACYLAKEAMNLLQKMKDGYDIVLSDVNISDMDSFKFLEHVGLEMDLPVIMMSCNKETSRLMKGVEHGACNFLLKPIRMNELRNIWQHVLRRRMIKENRLCLSKLTKHNSAGYSGTQNSISYIQESYASNHSYGFDGQLCFNYGSPSCESTGSISTGYSCNMLNRDGFFLQNVELRSYESDEEETVLMPVGPSTVSESTEISNSSIPRTEFGNPSNSSGSEVNNIGAFDSPFLFEPKPKPSDK